MKTFNTIYTDAIDIIKEGLCALNEEGWAVKRSGQPNSVSLTRPSIILDIISSPRYGWQHSRDIVGETIIHQELFYQDINFQLTAFKKPFEENNTAVDTCFGLACWLNSERGINFIKKKNYGISRITEIRTGIFVNEEEGYERNPSFDFSLNCLQVVSTNVEEIKKIAGKLEGV